MTLSHQLQSLVQADPVLISYVLAHLGEGVPFRKSNQFYWTNIQNICQEMQVRLLRAAIGLEAPEPQISTEQLDKLERQWAQLLIRTEARRRLLSEVANSDPNELRAKLTDARAFARLAAARVIADRRAHFEDDLIERLADRSNAVVQEARRALVRLARGTDFGPPPRANKAARERAIARWKGWLTLQRDADAAPDADLRLAADQVLGRHTVTLSAVDPEVARLREELLRAKGEDRAAVLQRLREEKGVVHTEALIAALPQLPDGVRAKAREALVERMTRMTAETLRDKFAQDDAEVRRAAALACARKGDKEMVADLIDLIGDSDGPVVQAARASLQKLTGKDFGPASDGPDEQARAVAAWNDWREKKEARR